MSKRTFDEAFLDSGSQSALECDKREFDQYLENYNNKQTLDFWTVENGLDGFNPDGDNTDLFDEILKSCKDLGQSVTTASELECPHPTPENSVSSASEDKAFTTVCNLQTIDINSIPKEVINNFIETTIQLNKKMEQSNEIEKSNYGKWETLKVAPKVEESIKPRGKPDIYRTSFLNRRPTSLAIPENLNSSVSYTPFTENVTPCEVVEKSNEQLLKEYIETFEYVAPATLPPRKTEILYANAFSDEEKLNPYSPRFYETDFDVVDKVFIKQQHDKKGQVRIYMGQEGTKGYQKVIQLSAREAYLLTQHLSNLAEEIKHTADQSLSASIPCLRGVETEISQSDPKFYDSKACTEVTKGSLRFRPFYFPGGDLAISLNSQRFGQDNSIVFAASQIYQIVIALMSQLQRAHEAEKERQELMMTLMREKVKGRISLLNIIDP
jgi:hypothetical protein